MSICRMGESGLNPGWRMRSVRLSGFFQDRAHILVYMESYCISVICKL